MHLLKLDSITCARRYRASQFTSAAQLGAVGALQAGIGIDSQLGSIAGSRCGPSSNPGSKRGLDRREGFLLEGVCLSLGVGDCIAITGSNGAGKSTLLHICAGLLRPDSGSVHILEKQCVTEKDFAAQRKHLGYLLQQAEDQLFCPTVLEDVAFGPYNYGASRDEATDKAMQTLGMLGLEHLAARNGSRLSGGEQRLAAFAAVLACGPSFLVLDEPTSDLDHNGRRKLLQMLDVAALPLLVVSHDLGFVQAIASQQYRLEQGRLNRV